MTRKTKTALITVCLLLTVTVVYALAAAGGASDPLASSPISPALSPMR